MDNNPSVEQFFDPIDKSKSVLEESGTDVELPDVGISKDENSHPARASVSPTPLLLATGSWLELVNRSTLLWVGKEVPAPAPAPP